MERSKSGNPIAGGPGVSITLTTSASPLPGNDSRYVDFEIAGAKMLGAIAFSDVFIAGFIRESTVYGYAEPVTSDTRIHPPTTRTDRPYRNDGYRFCYEKSQADLSISKTASATPVDPLDNISYILTVSNAGPDDATGVTVTDTLPAGVSLVSASDGGTESGGVVTWTGLSVPAEGSVELTVVVNVDLSSEGSTLENSATVIAGNETDPVPGNNGPVVAAVEVNAAEVDLAITKVGPEADFVTPGSDIDYTITVGVVSGNVPATDVVVTDDLPDGLTVTESSLPAGCSLNEDGDTITCDVDVPATIAYTARAGAESAGLSLTNTASVVGGETDPVPGNNEASASIEVVRIVTPGVPVIDVVDGGQVTTECESTVGKCSEGGVPIEQVLFVDSAGTINLDVIPLGTGGGDVFLLTTFVRELTALPDVLQIDFDAEDEIDAFVDITPCSALPDGNPNSDPADGVPPACLLSSTVDASTPGGPIIETNVIKLAADPRFR